MEYMTKPPNDFPLCKKLGLDLERVYADGLPRNPSDYWLSVRADELEKILSEAPVVYGIEPKGGNYWSDKSEADDTRQARLLLVEPIKQESEERKLLREMLESFVNDMKTPPYWAEYIARMKALIEREDE